MINKKILDHLEKANIKYEIVPHKKVYTAYDASQTLKVQPKQIVKSLIIKIKNDFALILIGADKNVDFKKLAKQFKILEKDIKIPNEKILIAKLKINPGTAHVFGTLYNIPVLIEKGLAETKEAIFSSGSFTESLKIKVADFIKHQEANVGNFGIAKKIKKALVHRNLSAGGKKATKSIKGKKTKTKKTLKQSNKKLPTKKVTKKPQAKKIVKKNIKKPIKKSKIKTKK